MQKTYGVISTSRKTPTINRASLVVPSLEDSDPRRAHSLGFYIYTNCPFFLGAGAEPLLNLLFSSPNVLIAALAFANRVSVEFSSCFVLSTYLSRYPPLLRGVRIRALASNRVGLPTAPLSLSLMSVSTGHMFVLVLASPTGNYPILMAAHFVPPVPPAWRLAEVSG